MYNMANTFIAVQLDHNSTGSFEISTKGTCTSPLFSINSRYLDLLPEFT